MPKKQEVAHMDKQDKSAKAIVRYLRISPRKMRLVIDAIRRQHVYKAFGILAAIQRKAARMTEKALKSAVANAKVSGMNEERLYVASVFADGGPTLKRFMSRSMGRADRLLKRTTHLSVVVKEGQKTFRKPGHVLMEETAVEATPKGKKKKQKASAKA